MKSSGLCLQSRVRWCVPDLRRYYQRRWIELNNNSGTIFDSLVRSQRSTEIPWYVGS